jgi:uncharacterized cysteine cluster protein YcgN (CxxCxxCC family)
MSRRRQRIANKPAHGDWDSRCRQCGFCCFEKFENDDGTIYYTQNHCRYLDPSSRSCTVYEQRFSVNPECVQLTPELARTLKWLHPECGYRTSAD